MKWLEQISSQYPVKSFDKNEIILYQGIRPDHVMVIKSGLVKGYDISSQGNEQLVWFGREHDYFPVPWAHSVTNGTLFFYEAFIDTQVYCIPQNVFISNLEKDMDTMREAIREMAGFYTDSLTRLNAVEKPKATEKILYTLSYLAQKFGKTQFGSRDHAEITLPLTHQDIANLLGLTRETIAVELKRLKDSGYIYYDKWRFTIFVDKLADIL